MTGPVEQSGRTRVLICDPDAKFIHRARSILEASGYGVLVAIERSMAMEMVLSSSPQVVLLSSEVAQTSHGGEVMTLLRRLRPRPALIITMTMARFDLAQKAWQLGADEAVFKPLLGDTELLGAISRAMSKAATAIEASAPTPPRAQDEAHHD